MNLNDREWKEFKISDIFQIELSAGDNQANLLEEGNFPLVSSGMNNNGVCKFIKTGDSKSQMFNGNIITIDMFGKTFYHPYNFFAVSHGRVNMLFPKFKINKEVGIFLVKAIENSTTGKYSYNRMCSRSRLENQLITLPVNLDNSPDYEFMESYIKEKENKMISKYNKYLETLD